MAAGNEGGVYCKVAFGRDTDICIAMGIEGSLPGRQNSTNENRAEKYSVNSSYAPMPVGRFLATTWEAGCRAGWIVWFEDVQR